MTAKVTTLSSWAVSTLSGRRGLTRFSGDYAVQTMWMDANDVIHVQSLDQPAICFTRDEWSSITRAELFRRSHRHLLKTFRDCGVQYEPTFISVAACAADKAKQDSMKASSLHRYNEVKEIKKVLPWTVGRPRREMQEQPRVDPHTPIQEEGQPMNEFMNGAQELGSLAAAATWQGTKMATYRQMVRRARKKIEEKLGDKYPEFAQTEAGRTVIDYMIANAVLSAAFLMPETTPVAGKHKAKIIENAQLAVAATAERGMDGMMDLLLDEAVPILMMFAGEAAEEERKTPIQIPEQAPDFEAEAARPSRRRREAVPVAEEVAELKEAANN